MEANDQKLKKEKKRVLAVVETIEPAKLYRLEQIQANFLGGVTRTTVTRWIKQGRFPSPVKISPRLLMWRGADLLQALNER